MGKTVQTARGPVNVADLGRVLMHEHVFVVTAEVQQNYPEEWGDEERRVADAVRRLSELPANGSFQQRCDLVVEMCCRGYADRMVLSHDCSCYLDWFAQSALDDLKGWHYLHVSQDVVPYLRDHGVSDDQLAAMLVGTPPASWPAGNGGRRVRLGHRVGLG